MRRCRGGLNGDCSALNFSGCDKSATTTKTTLFVFLALAVATIKAPIFYCLCIAPICAALPPIAKVHFRTHSRFPFTPFKNSFFFFPFPPFLPPPLCKIDSLLVKCFYPTATHPPQHTQQRSLEHCGSNGAVYYYGVERWWKEVVERGGKGSCSNSFLPPLPPCFISTQSMTTKHACQPEPCSRGVA